MARAMHNDRMLTVRFPDKLMKELRREADIRGVSVGVIVRERVMFSKVIVKSMAGHLSLTDSAVVPVKATKVRRKVP